MKIFALTSIVGALFCTAILAASAPPVGEHIRGQIVSVTKDTLIVKTDSGPNVSIALNEGTHYLGVVKGSLDSIGSGNYIGTATKSVGSNEIALEVVIFPAAMQGVNPGHFAYDKLLDTTVSGNMTKVASNMTNGSVSSVTAPKGGTVNTSMTNGSVSASTSQNGVKQLTVTYSGGQQTILVPPTAAVVNLQPATMAEISKGESVFVDAARNGDTLTAGLVAAGVGGVHVPF